MIHEIKASLVDIILQLIDDLPFRDLISRFNHSIYDIRIIFAGIPVKSGVPSVLFQGWAIRTSDIKSLKISLKIGHARKGHFSWRMDFNLTQWKKTVDKQNIVKELILADMEVYFGTRIYKN